MENRSEERPASFHSTDDLIKDGRFPPENDDDEVDSLTLQRSNSERGTKASARRRGDAIKDVATLTTPSSAEYYKRRCNKNNDVKRRERRRTTDNILGGAGGGSTGSGAGASVNAMMPTRWSQTPEVLAQPEVVETLTSREKRQEAGVPNQFNE